MDQSASFSGATPAQEGIRLAEAGDIQQPQPVLASGPQNVEGVDAKTRITPPPLPTKTEDDWILRGNASRPLSSTPESNYEPASGSRAGSPAVVNASRPMSSTPESDEPALGSQARSHTVRGAASRPMSEPGLQTGVPLPREAVRRSSMAAAQSQVPYVTRGREGRASVRIDGSPPDRQGPPPARRQSTATQDWMVPENEKVVPRTITAGQRLQPTLDHANSEKKKFERRGMLNGWALNTAIAIQIILGALVTGLSSVVNPTKVGLVTSILGGLSTLVASYLARMRGSREPELSLARVTDLDHFIRDVEVFQLDLGRVNDATQDTALDEFRRRFEELLGVAEA